MNTTGTAPRTDLDWDLISRVSKAPAQSMQATLRCKGCGNDRHPSAFKPDGYCRSCHAADAYGMT